MILGIVQARFSSSRLPGKVLATAGNRPLLWHAVHRLQAAGVCTRVVVATSVEPSDDPVVDYCSQEGFQVFRGELEDVLDRFYRAATFHGAEHVVRVTADCPLLDAALVGRVVRHYLAEEADYASNSLERTFPDGLDVEVFSYRCLERAWREARLASEREHVTPYLWKQPGKFRLTGVRQSVDRSELRWTVDEPRDLEFVRAVFEEMDTTDFGQEEILALIDRRPELGRINEGIHCNEGYRRSLERDRSGGA